MRFLSPYIASLVVSFMTAPAGIASAEQTFSPFPDYVPDSIKIYVTEGRMVQFTGDDIQRCLTNANRAEVTEEVEGEEILKLGGAADGRGQESDGTGGIEGTWDTEVSVVRSKDETGSAPSGEYCLKISGPNSNRTKDSGIHQPSARFVLPGNSRFRFTCRVYCKQQGNRFALALQNDRRFLTSLHSTQIWAKNADNTGEYFQNTPGEWTEFNGILTTLDEGDREYRLWIHHDEGGPMTWYLDDIAIVPLRTEMRRVPFREKSQEEAGLTLADLNANHVNLYNRGKPIPISIENAAGDGRFLNETTVSFWGDPPAARDGGENVFTPENTYVLSFDSPDPPSRYRPAPPAPRQAGAAVFRSFPRTRRVEENNHLQYYQKYDGPPTDRVMWASFKAPPWEPATVELPPLHDAAGELTGIQVKAHVWGWSDLPVSPDHFWKFSMNDAPLGNAQWDGSRLCVVEATMPGTSVFRDRANILTVEPTNDNLQLDLVSLDWIELTYDAALLPRDDFLEFTAQPATASRYAQTEAAFSDSAVQVFWEGSELVQTPASYAKRNRHAVEFPLDQAGGRYRVVGSSGFAEAARLAVGYESNLRRRDIVPEYLIVSHASFLEALRPVVERRIEQGLRTLVVDVEDLYDEYSDGIFDPEAIRLFVNDLGNAQESDGTTLKYIWLVGDATYDYMGIRPGSRNYVPTHHTDDADILPSYSPTIAHDDYFAFGPQGSDVPLAAVGRLPASSIETVKAYVAKILEYEEGAGDDAAWRQRAILISSKDFNRFSNDTAENVLSGWSVEDLTGTGDQEGDIRLRNSIVDRITAGCGVVTFTGHGAYYVWRTGENMNDQRTDMLTDREIDRLANSGKYPIVFAATCFSSLFDAPIHGMSRADSGVGIYFVQAEDKGAVALVGHVGKVDVAAGHQFNRAMLEGLIAHPGTRLGDQFLQTKRRFPDRAFHGVALIGDPALVALLQ